MKHLTRSNYAIPSDRLAPALIGCTLVRVLPGGERLAGMIVETEAYLAPEDQASHAKNGRRTKRTEPFYMAAGTSYVYFTYGMHYCFNVIADEPGSPQAVLVRALEPVEGLDVMRAHRSGARASVGVHAARSKPSRAPIDTELCSGPAKLCQAMAIGPAHNAVDLTRPGRQSSENGAVWIEGPAGRFGEGRGVGKLAKTPRIGVESAGEPWASAPLRWVLGGSPYASKGPKPEANRRRPPNL